MLILKDTTIKGETVYGYPWPSIRFVKYDYLIGNITKLYR